MVRRVNGVLYPGGEVDFSVKGGYAEAGKFIYKWAIKVSCVNQRQRMIYFFIHTFENLNLQQT